jgi:hypothetical protein
LKECGTVPIQGRHVRTLASVHCFLKDPKNNSMRRNTMKSLILAVALMGLTGITCAEETLGEKAEAATNDATRSVKKGVHRAQETVCAEGDMKCLSEKAKHRAEEGKDYTQDKAKELKNDVDSDKK